MSKKHKKHSGKKGGPRRSNNNGGKFDLMSILTDKDMMIGLAAGVVGGAAIEVLGKKFITNGLIRSGLESIVPAVAVGYFTKNKNSAIAAAGAGAAIGFGAMAISKISEMTTKTAAAPVTPVKGLIGEDIFAQTEGGTPVVRGADGRYYPVAQVSGNDDFVPVEGDDFIPVEGEEDESVSGMLEGDDEFSVSGDLDEI